MPKSKTKKAKKQSGGAIFKQVPDQGLLNFRKPMPSGGPERKRPTVQPVITGQGLFDKLDSWVMDKAVQYAIDTQAKHDRNRRDVLSKASNLLAQRGGAAPPGGIDPEWDAPPPSGPAPAAPPMGVGAPDYYNAPNSPAPMLPPAGVAPPAYQGPDPYANGGVDMKYFYDVPKPSDVPFVDPGEPGKKKKKLGGIVSAMLRGIGARSWADKAEQSGWGAQQQTGMGAVTGPVAGMSTC